MHHYSRTCKKAASCLSANTPDGQEASAPDCDMRRDTFCELTCACAGWNGIAFETERKKFSAALLELANSATVAMSA